MNETIARIFAAALVDTAGSEHGLPAVMRLDSFHAFVRTDKRLHRRLCRILNCTRVVIAEQKNGVRDVWVWNSKTPGGRRYKNKWYLAGSTKRKDTCTVSSVLYKLRSNWCSYTRAVLRETSFAQKLMLIQPHDSN